MHSRLKAILTEKKAEVAGLKKKAAFREISASQGKPRDFKKAVTGRQGIALITEIKFASPSAGRIRVQEDPVPIACRFEQAGAAAISFLTDRTFFGGDLELLPKVKQAVDLPILRKDFILDAVQVQESRYYGADAILLIVRILSREQLQELLQAAQEMGLTALVEVHDRNDLEQALLCGADLIGINNRNLDTFEVDLKTTRDLAPLVPADHGPISESGIHTAEDIRTLNQCGIKAFLVGTAIMQAEDVEGKIRELREG